MIKQITIILAVLVSNMIFAQNNAEKEIENIVHAYEEALNNGNVEKVLQQFTSDGILLLQGSPTIKGTEAMKGFYSSIFNVIDFDLAFNIEELVEISDEWAYVRTITSSKTDLQADENGHEIFLFNKKEAGQWRIARYAGSSAK